MIVVTGRMKKTVQRNPSAVHQTNLNVTMDVAYHYDGNVIRNKIVTVEKMRKIAVTLETTIVNATMMNIRARIVDVFSSLGYVMEHQTVSVVRMKLIVM